MPEAPELKQFRVERSTNGVLHLVFDMPGRSMNVFSNAAIGELGTFADWLPQTDVADVVIRSGKTTAFCAGADLAELETAYEMVMAASPAERDRVAFDHFFRLSQGLRKLETAGKPVAVTIAGLALGGGAEFALAAHHRVLTDQPQSMFGLPESAGRIITGGGRDSASSAPDRHRGGAARSARGRQDWGSGGHRDRSRGRSCEHQVKKWRQRSAGCCRARLPRSHGIGRTGEQRMRIGFRRWLQKAVRRFWPRR